MVDTSNCPACGRQLKVERRLVGKRCRCPACATAFVLDAVAFSGPASIDAGCEARETRLAWEDAEEHTIADLVPRPGELVGTLGRFELRGVLGQGGFGTVYLAFDPVLERDVALKVPKLSSEQGRRVARFLREAKAAARLNHSNIAAVHEAGEEDGNPYFVMEYVSGIDLGTLVRRQGPLPVDVALDYVIQAARGLEHAHRHGTIHRDVKPSNLMLDREGTVKVLDMGLARVAPTERAEQESNDSLTHSGQIMGTVDYMAPEQAEDARSADGRADIYSLGCTLWTLLTGCALYNRESLVGRLMAHRQSAIPSLTDYCPAVTESLDTAFRRMVAKNPEERYTTMSQVIASLEKCRAGDDSEVTATSHDVEESSTAPQSAFPVIEPPRSTRTMLRSTRRVQDVQRLVVGVGLIGLLVAGIALAVVLRLRTPEGTLVVELNQPDAQVEIDGKKFKITTPGEREPIEFQVEEGQHTLRVTKGGFVSHTESFAVTRLGKTTVRVELQPAGGSEPPPPTPTSPAPAEFDEGGNLLHAGERWNGLLPLLDPDRDTIMGRWEIRDAQLHVYETPELYNRLEIPVIPLGSYEFRVAFTRTSGEGDVALRLPAGWGAVAMLLRDRAGEPTALLDVQEQHRVGQDAVRPVPLSNGVSHTVLARVRLDPQGDQVNIEMLFDDVPSLAWRGPQRALSVHPYYAGPRSETLALGSQGDVIFHNVELRVLDDSARRYVPPLDEWADPAATIRARGGTTEVDSAGNVTRVMLSRVVDHELLHLAKLPHIKALHVMGDCAVSSLGARFLGELTSLEELDLTFSSIDDAAIPALVRLSNLSVLSLHGTRVTDAGLAQFRQLAKLQTLHVGWTRVTDDGMALLKDFPALKSLHMPFLDIGDAGAEHLAQLSNLEELHFLDAPRLTDAGLERLTAITGLRRIRLWNTAITDEGLRCLAKFSRLESLNIGGCRIGDAGMRHLAGLPLSELDLSSTQITSSGLTHLKTLEQLRVLQLRETRIDDSAVEHLVALSGLTHLELNRTGITAEGVAKLRSALPSCSIAVEPEVESQLPLKQ